ncbi:MULTISPECIES: heat-inducible transcriptional repressor HrcA [Carnobacterium]|uniref:heat-inducible transcriptional repressor HrcA n=1 Tax=Carnobacterium TaxID=2747 RepID=UPI000D4755D9|nr:MULTISPECIES: heat-inducible transcriptional repressor HrcA [Carnobacterium]MCO6017904.1 heat-inducible transcriptional repressor HrcA [Carnobacterium divergens]MDT1938739.1 heat-inducible transcriptional repressor HrcA [Carnobacterium divergens]MDT1941177.1 heat-inducible transcriptional repressor HrcA [Carnobacterium divergens]MDT1946975.1 heat-inducible transcriptional repressor HrcA [Carnobacterium divergens]MDT1949412.1 heat-inducible transcriptional repressor HrcA [Carnobacterium dive
MLTERQILILKSIIRLYTDFGNPVGSKTLMNEAGLDFSSATIRNEMGRLEELGYIEKTHSSSGRIPSIKGYRFYVDHLVHPDKVNSKDLATIKSSFNSPFHELDEIVAQSAEVLSNLTSYTAITLGPELKDSKLTGFRLVPLSNFQVMAILVTDKGHVENQIFNLPKNINSYELEKIVAIFNDELIGYPLVLVYQKLKTEIPQLIQKYVRTPSGILDVFDDIIMKAAKERVFVGGRMNILDFSNALDVEKFKSIYTLMEKDSGLASLITQNQEGIEVRIGQELENTLFQDFSLITATYSVVGHGTGTIALLGPTSMPYSRMIGLVDAFRNELSQKMMDYYQGMEK